MSIKAGQLIHVANQILVDRAQTAGPGSVTINREKIYELGNYLSVGSVADIPDLSFSVESYDVSAQLEAILTNQTFAGMADGTALDVSTSTPIDVVSQFKTGKNAIAPYNVAGAVAIPYLTLESLSYKFGISNDASQTATLKGDGLYFTPGSAYVQEATGSNTPNQSVVLTHSAYPYNGDSVAGTKYALSVSLSTGERLSYGADYTEAATGTGTTRAVTVTILKAVPSTSKIRIVYSSDTVASYPQVSHAAVSATRPAALRGRNITVAVGGVLLANRWTSVQSVQLDWKVTLQKDEEFGNSNIVAQDFDVPDVTGNIGLKPRDYNELYSKVCTIAGVGTSEVAGALTTNPIPLYMALHSPDDGSVLKSFYVPDARFNLPGFSGRVQNKLEVQFDFTSDTGALTIYKGAKAGATG